MLRVHYYCDKARSAHSPGQWSHQLLRSERSRERRGRMGTRETEQRAEICLARLAWAWLWLWAGLHSKLRADFITPQRLWPLSGQCKVIWWLIEGGHVSLMNSLQEEGPSIQEHQSDEFVLRWREHRPQLVSQVRTDSVLEQIQPCLIPVFQNDIRREFHRCNYCDRDKNFQGIQCVENLNKYP